MTKLWRAAPAASVEAGSPWADSQYSRNALMIFGNDSQRQDYCGNSACQWSVIACGFLAMRNDLDHLPGPKGREPERVGAIIFDEFGHSTATATGRRNRSD